MQRIPTILFTLTLTLAITAAIAAQTAPAGKPQGASQSPSANRNSDREFAQKAAAGGKKEVEGAKFAASKAANGDVKTFAERLVKDHTAANQELASLMKTKQLTVPSAAKEAPEAWRNQSGTAFDRAYINHAIDHHEKDIAMFEAEASNGTDAELKAWAARKLPTLREHLKIAQDLKGKLGTTNQ